MNALSPDATIPASGAPDRAATQAQRAAETVSAFSIDRATETRGFLAFYAKARPDKDIYGEDPEDTKKVFEAFDMVKGLSRRFEKAMSQKLHAESTDEKPKRLTYTEQKACREHVESLAAAGDPEALLQLARDLDALESNPAEIARKEALFAEIVAANDAATLTARKEALEQSAITAQENLIQTIRKGEKLGWGSRFAGRLGFGKAADNAMLKETLAEELRQIDTNIRNVETQIATAPGLIAQETEHIKQVRAQLDSARAKVFEDNAVTQMVRQRLLNENRKEFAQALNSPDLEKKQKAARQFVKEHDLAKEKVSNYLDEEGKAFDREAFVKALWEGGKDENGREIVGMKELFRQEMDKVLGQIAKDAKKSEVWKQFTKVIELTKKGLGFMSSEESIRFVLGEIEQARGKLSSGDVKKTFLDTLKLKLTGPVIAA